jgi:deoxyribonuclease V
MKVELNELDIILEGQVEIFYYHSHKYNGIIVEIFKGHTVSEFEVREGIKNGFEKTAQTIAVCIDKVEDYESGSFYKRELPCIVELLKKIDRNSINIIIIDGYVYLNNDLKPGLGYYLYEYLNENIPIIGVAKKTFHNNLNVIPLLRGKSNTPLYITSAGIDLSEAAESIKKMYGEFRIPTLLKLTDQLTRRF